MAKLVVFRSRERVAVFELRGKLVRVGRERSCHLQLDDRLISREHLRFLKDSDGWSVLDLASPNGTFVNDERISAPVQLEEGDLITLGQHVLVFRKEELTSTESVAAVAHMKRWRGPGTESTHRLPQVKQEDLLARARLRLKCHLVVLGDDPKAVPLEDPDLTVGYSADCGLVLPGRAWFAGQVFALNRDAQEAWFVTALSKRVKVTVNGQPVEQRKLEDGDVIGVRKVSVRFHTAVAVS